MAVMGVRELAFGLAHYALKSFGISDEKAALITLGARMSGEGGAFDRRPDFDPHRAPELRPHCDEADNPSTR